MFNQAVGLSDASTTSYVLADNAHEVVLTSGNGVPSLCDCLVVDVNGPIPTCDRSKTQALTP